MKKLLILFVGILLVSFVVGNIIAGEREVDVDYDFGDHFFNQTDHDNGTHVKTCLWMDTMRTGCSEHFPKERLSQEEINSMLDDAWDDLMDIKVAEWKRNDARVVNRFNRTREVNITLS